MAEGSSIHAIEDLGVAGLIHDADTDRSSGQRLRLLCHRNGIRQRNSDIWFRDGRDGGVEVENSLIGPRKRCLSRLLTNNKSVIGFECSLHRRWTET